MYKSSVVLQKFNINNAIKYMDRYPANGTCKSFLLLKKRCPKIDSIIPVVKKITYDVEKNNGMTAIKNTISPRPIDESIGLTKRLDLKDT